MRFQKFMVSGGYNLERPFLHRFVELSKDYQMYLILPLISEQNFKESSTGLFQNGTLAKKKLRKKIKLLIKTY